MKITLISMDYLIQAYGIRILSSILKKEGYDVNILFLPKKYSNLYEESVLRNIKAFVSKSDLVGISVFTYLIDDAIQITREIRKMDIPVVWGGIHPTIKPNDCLKYCDYVIRGEAEESFLELIKNIEK